MSHLMRLRLLCLLSAFAFAVSLAAPTQAALVWYSTLDGDATATVGGVDGVPTGDPTATADRHGMAGGAVLFDGNDNFVIDKTTLPQSFSSGTIAAWVRNDAFNNGSERGFLAVGGSGGGSDNYFTMMRDAQSGGNMDTYRTDLDRGGSGVSGRVETDASGLMTGDWHHLAATFHTNGELTIYVDGVEIDSANLSGGTSEMVPTHNWAVGSERVSDRFWIGAVDDAAVWDSELSPAAVAGLASGAFTAETAQVELVRFSFNDTAARGASNIEPSFVHPAVADNMALNIDPAVIGGTNGTDLTLAVDTPGTNYATEPVLRAWPANNNDLAEAIDNDGYFEFTVEPASGFELDLDALVFDAGRGGGSTPRGWGLTTSLDDFATVLDLADIPTTRPNFTNFSVDLTDAAFQDLTEPLTFRMYVYSPGDGSTVEFDNFRLLGRAQNVIPEPATAGLMLIAAAGLVARRRRRA